MANVLVEETSLSNIASAIRVKNGSTAVYKPGEMAAAITNLPTGGGSSDNEDGLLEDTLVNYENTTATKIRKEFFMNSTKLATATFTNVSVVDAAAFSNCSALTQVSLPNAVTINPSCFYGSKKLLTADLSNTKYLSNRAFSGCTSLTSINLPRVEILNMSVFFDCSNLAKADLGSCKEFSQLGSSQFSHCNKLTTLILRSNNHVCYLPYSIENALGNTPFTDSSLGQGYLYVPRALLDTYKNESNWTVIADRIRAIEDYPEITGG